MKTSIISLVDSEDETVDGEYYIIEDGWVTFKTAEHKAVAAYPEARVTRIKSSAVTHEIGVHLNASMLHTPSQIAEIVAARRDTFAAYGK